MNPIDHEAQESEDSHRRIEDDPHGPGDDCEQRQACLPRAGERFKRGAGANHRLACDAPDELRAVRFLRSRGRSVRPKTAVQGMT